MTAEASIPFGLVFDHQVDCVLTFEVVDLSIVWVVYECNPAPDPVRADQCNLAATLSRDDCVPKFEVGSSDVDIIVTVV